MTQYVIEILVRDRPYITIKKVSFEFAAVSFSIGVLDIPKKFSERSELKNAIARATPIFTVTKLIHFV